MNLTATKLKISVHKKTSTKKLNKQCREWEKIFAAAHISDKEIVFGIKNYYKIPRKQFPNSQFKNWIQAGHGSSCL